MNQNALSKPPSPLQLRDQLETMVLKELLGPGSAEEEIIESPGTWYFVGVLAHWTWPKSSDRDDTATGWIDLGHGFHETKQGVRYTISEPARREVLARLLKLNHERYAEEVQQGLHEKKKPKATKGKKKAKANTQFGPSLFQEKGDDA